MPPTEARQVQRRRCQFGYLRGHGGPNLGLVEDQALLGASCSTTEYPAPRILQIDAHPEPGWFYGKYFLRFLSGRRRTNGKRGEARAFHKTNPGIAKRAVKPLLKHCPILPDHSLVLCRVARRVN